MNRKVEDWIQSYMDFVSSHSAPSRFHRWCAVSTICACLERDVYVHRGYFTTYPNMFVVLAGDSATMKSTAINIAQGLVHQAEAKYKDTMRPIYNIGQQATPQRMVQSLLKYHNKYNVSAGYVIASELSVFLSRQKLDGSLVQLLTDLYDCPEYHVRETIKHGTEALKKVCLNMLAGSTPIWIKESLPASALQGGFVGRLQFVYSPTRGKRHAFPELSVEQIKMREALVDTLPIIRKIKGEFTWAPDAKEWYRHWFEEESEDEELDDKLSGYYARKGETLVKVATATAAARHDDKEIKLDDVKDAYAWIMENEAYLPYLINRLRSNPAGDTLNELEDIIKKSPKGISRSDLLKKLQNVGMSAALLTTHTHTLIEQGTIKKEERNPTGHGKATFYVPVTGYKRKKLDEMTEPE